MLYLMNLEKFKDFFLIYKTTYFPVFRREMGISCAGYTMEETGTEILNQLLKDSS